MKKHNNHLLLVFFLFPSLWGGLGWSLDEVVSAQPTYTWAKNIGSTGKKESTSITVDGNGNVYITGSFTSTADFDPGAGTANLSPVGNYDVFFAKYDASGTYLWAKNIGSTGADASYSIAVDGNGNVYITGSFTGTADFDPGAGTANLTSVGFGDIFFAKYDASGAYVWAKSTGSISSDISYSIAVDGSGNVYITGAFTGTADFDPGAGTLNLTSVGLEDIFFAKYDASGAYLWAKNIGSIGSDISYGIAVDGSGNVFITGAFTGTADFDPAAGTANLTSIGGIDIFFAKYDASGSYFWAKNIGSTGYDYASSITVDGSSNVFITGSLDGTADFDPGAGTANLSSVGGPDTFFAKYDASGVYLWANLIASATSFGSSIAVDGSGNVFITGYFTTIADFDPGAGTAIITLTGTASDIFFAKYNASGAYLWAQNIGSTQSDIGQSIAVDGSANVYITGQFTGTADFDPGAGTANLTSVGNTSDIFFAKYGGGVTGVEHPFFAAPDIIVYPNPASGKFRLSLPLSLSQGGVVTDKEGTLEVYSVIGEKIFSSPVGGGSEWALDLSAQPDGIYFLNIKTKNGSFPQKIIIQNP